MTLPSSALFAKVYNSAFKAIMAHKKERYTFTGGRASCKSSFISICIVLLIVKNPEYNALILRKTANTLRRSVFEQRETLDIGRIYIIDIAFKTVDKY